MKISALALALTASGLFAVVACTGGSGDSSSGGLEQSDGGGGSANDGGGGGNCTTAGVFTGERVCVPGTARANTALSVEAQAQGCLSCTTSIEACNVTVDGSIIKLSLTKRTCEIEGACPAVCGVAQKTCAIPPLAAGRYLIEITNAESVKSTGGRELVVAAEGEVSCALDARLPTEIKATNYTQQCGEDSDCELVSEGDPCARCAACPSAAVAKTEVERLRGDYREEHALCAGDLSAECAACPPQLKAVCKPNGMCGTEPLE